MDSLDGPKFVRFASRLVYYAGAVQGKIKLDYQNMEDSGGETTSSDGAKISMKEAMGRYSDDLDALNYESEAGMAGTLFERVAVDTQN